MKREMFSSCHDMIFLYFIYADFENVMLKGQQCTQIKLIKRNNLFFKQRQNADS